MSNEFKLALKHIIGLKNEHKECWYIVVYLYAFFGIFLPLENPGFQVFNRKHFWYPVDKPEFMDLIVFGSGTHVGVALDSATYIHASFYVQIDKFSQCLEPYKVYRYGFKIL